MYNFIMKYIERVENEKQLLQLLFKDVEECEEEKIVFLGGHFPLFYKDEKALESFKYWGNFSEYTLELACRLAKHATDHGKKIGFVFFVDDHMHEPLSGLSASQLSSRRNSLYKTRSGHDAVLPDTYRNILQKYEFSEKDVIRHNHGKTGREDCLYFSEKILRSSTRNIENLCALEYVAFLEDDRYFSLNNCYMMAFIPQRCRENICHYAIDLEVKNLKGSHVFIESMLGQTTVEELYTSTSGVNYRKD